VGDTETPMNESIRLALLDKIDARLTAATRRELDERINHPARLGDGTAVGGNTVEGYARSVVATLTGRALLATDGTVAAAPLVGAALRRAVAAILDDSSCQAPLRTALRDWASEAAREKNDE